VSRDNKVTKGDRAYYYAFLSVQTGIYTVVTRVFWCILTSLKGVSQVFL